MLVLGDILSKYGKVISSELHWGIDDWCKYAFKLPYCEHLYKYNLELRPDQSAFGIGATTYDTIRWF